MGYSDYVQNTGSSGGQMLIRVADASGQAGVIAGNDVKFFVRSGLTATFVGTPGFGTSVYANGGWITLNNVSNYSNSTAWREVGTVRITTSQTITFHINASSTQGFGGPTDFPLFISRASPPQAPTPLDADEIKHQSFRYRFTSNGNGGAPVLEKQIGYGYNTSTPQWTMSSSGTSELGPFIPGSVVYAWSRERNSAGWGPWSARTTVQLKRGVKVNWQGVYKDAVPYINDFDVWKPFELFVNDSGDWKPAGIL